MKYVKKTENQFRLFLIIIIVCSLCLWTKSKAESKTIFSFHKKSQQEKNNLKSKPSIFVSIVSEFHFISFHFFFFYLILSPHYIHCFIDHFYRSLSFKNILLSRIFFFICFSWSIHTQCFSLFRSFFFWLNIFGNNQE